MLNQNIFHQIKHLLTWIFWIVVGGGGWCWMYFGCQWVLYDSGGYIFTGDGGLYRMAVDGAIA